MKDTTLIRISTELKKRLKIIAAEKDITMRQLLDEIIKKELIK